MRVPILERLVREHETTVRRATARARRHTSQRRWSDPRSANLSLSANERSFASRRATLPSPSWPPGAGHACLLAGAMDSIGNRGNTNPSGEVGQAPARGWWGVACTDGGSSGRWLWARLVLRPSPVT